MKKRNQKFMQAAIALAKKGIGKTSPNPAVGAVIVKNDRIIGKGYHKKAGLAHAEINAMRQAGVRARGADMYVTLEPCNRFGRTPPCADAIIKAGIKSVYVGMKDPNPLIRGAGIRHLRNAGINVEDEILIKESADINRPYIKYITTKKPFVTLKLASTIDGRIATQAAESKWITGKEARKFAHKMRSNADAVMVGIGTILKDDPELTVRLIKGKNPIKIVVDNRLRIPINAKVLNPKKGDVIIATTKGRGQKSEARSQRNKKIKTLKAKGAEVLMLPSKMGEVDLIALMKELGKKEITSLIVEGGSRLAASAIKEGIVDKVAVFYAPKILGKEGLPMIGELAIKRLKDAIGLSELKCRKVGEDILVEGYLK
ncbi:MAG: riboflavin biosynthesis protein RibD [Deltaproteobacteria bacterium GWC2_42_51]|nr:MAG: riboflavin biosynthesis protein RibD [Bdellovibrionales bacterium RIFOXYB2_FULL_36_6]OGP06763.1 MAG: riboflavin biosynthesis protein RibD [Deltaproteobacteria bacterium GWA2_42_85]OGP31750.1 MAG: riboflavin biosynthesis protein RibD [Deltaproteobacteria bacterium GWB2_42_7]OGP32416.1 MAG: riboflavin biosynthesis protein RibD [Deltaproteobacteria bacterium GWC2_42_51]OGP38840.1 MAG: riboflavin biosynthesis protein RibD [Deltaproteobacteria bacterium GWD2_42_10]OGP47033.1 MAG: riboflavin